jgi:adenine deaminase
MLTWPETVALGEMMNFPGVLNADPAIAAQLWQARNIPLDGHAPALRGPDLSAYVAAGISSDHESFELDEAREKLRAGMFIMLRQGSSEKNLLDLLPLVTDETWHRITFCSDDRDCHDLLSQGHMDDILRTAIDAGLDPIRAIRMATWNPARHWNLQRLGAVAPGYRANLVTISDLTSVTVRHTLHNGRVVAEDGQLTVPVSGSAVPREARARECDRGRRSHPRPDRHQSHADHTGSEQWSSRTLR